MEITEKRKGTTMSEVYEFSAEEMMTERPKLMARLAAASKGGLWYADLAEAGVETVFVAFDSDEIKTAQILGWQTVSRTNKCVAIESYSQGVGSELVEASGCWQPEHNENPAFWAKMAERFGE